MKFTAATLNCNWNIRNGVYFNEEYPTKFIHIKPSFQKTLTLYYFYISPGIFPAILGNKHFIFK